MTSVFAVVFDDFLTAVLDVSLAFVIEVEVLEFVVVVGIVVVAV